MMRRALVVALALVAATLGLALAPINGILAELIAATDRYAAR